MQDKLYARKKSQLLAELSTKECLNQRIRAPSTNPINPGTRSHAEKFIISYITAPSNSINNLLISVPRRMALIREITSPRKIGAGHRSSTRISSPMTNTFRSPMAMPFRRGVFDSSVCIHLRRGTVGLRSCLSNRLMILFKRE